MPKARTTRKKIEKAGNDSLILNSPREEDRSEADALSELDLDEYLEECGKARFYSLFAMCLTGPYLLLLVRAHA